MNVPVFSSLRVRLIALVLLAAVPLLMLVVYSGVELRARAAETVRQVAAQNAALLANEQQRLVAKTRQLLSVLAQAPQVRQVNGTTCSAFLAQSLRQAGVYANLGVIRSDGDVVCSAVPMKGRVNVTDRSYFRRTLKSRDFAIGDYQIGRITHIAVLVFSYPVFDKSRRIEAVLFAALPLTWIKQPVTEFLAPPGSVVEVIDHSNHTLLARYPVSAINIGASIENSPLVGAMHASRGAGMADVRGPDGIRRLYVYRLLQNLPEGKEIYVAHGIPPSVVYAAANATMERNVFILVMVVSLVLVLAWYGSDALILRQVTRLLAATRRLASGDLDARVEVSAGKDELSEFGREFNKMALALEQRDNEAVRAEYLLRESEQRLRRVVETVPDILYTAHPLDLSTIFISPAITELLGYTQEDMTADPDRWAEAVHEDDREQVFTQVRSALDNGESGFAVGYRMWHKNGSEFRWFEDRGRIHRDDSGQATSIHGVMTDITERKEAERLSARMGRILEDAWNEIYVLDADTLRFADASKGACRNLGYTLEELKCFTLYDVQPDLTPGQFEALIGPLRRGEKTNVTLETEYQRKDGKRYPVEARLQLSSTESPPEFIAIVQDISERKRYIAEMERKALYDSLTGLPNRSLFQDRLKHALDMAHRQALSLAVFSIDVARLREVNDILGHSAGDLVLREVAGRLQHVLRKSDTIARLGGDEFGVILPGAEVEHARVAADKIQRQFEQPFIIDDTSLEIEAAVGIAMYPEHGDEPSMLLQHADIATHVAKNEAHGFSVFDPEDNPYSLRRLKLLGELRQVIERKQLVLYYQPKIDLALGRIISVEALARWPHSAEGMVSPGEFIPMVEQSGLIRPFTLWVLEEAIKQIGAWNREDIDLSVAVNLSTRNLLDPDLSANIEKLLSAYDVSPARLTLEVTESAVMSRPEFALKVLTQLRRMGLRLSIDDFGTGYSSLAYLKKLPVDELKIDQSFVLGVTTNEDDAVIVRSTIELARNMGLKVVAEGVENEGILDLLKVLGCDIGQGYHMCRPLPADELKQWMTDSPWGLRNNDIEI